MDVECKSIGEKISQNRKKFIEILGPIENLEVEFFTYVRKVSPWMDTLFLYLGTALSGEYLQMERKIKRWADSFGQRALACDINLNHSLHFILQSRKVIYEFLEEEAKKTPLPIALLIESYNSINNLIDLATRCVTSYYTRSIHDTKIALSHSHRDLIMTSANLRSLKTALYETTIFSVTDKNNHIIEVNDHFCRVTKYERKELIGQDHEKMLISGFHSEEFQTNIKDHIKAGKVWIGEICNKAKDGSLYWVDTTIIPFLDKDGVAYKHISVQYDITEKKKADELMIKSEKVSLIGDLAAGIAHEIRNPLTSIGGLVQLMGEDNSEKNNLYKNIIKDEISRINFIVSELMVLAKPHAIYFSTFNILENLRNIVCLLQPEANLRNVIFSFDLQEQEIQVYGEKNQLTQVIINLIKNAMEAMPDGGTIKLSAYINEEELILTVQDNGIGMNEDQKKQIGEPFYTTKVNGTGLGLMVCFKIIHNHRGTIEVDSVLKKGTSFKITLPLHSP